MILREGKWATSSTSVEMERYRLDYIGGGKGATNLSRICGGGGGGDRGKKVQVVVMVLKSEWWWEVVMEGRGWEMVRNQYWWRIVESRRSSKVQVET